MNILVHFNDVPVTLQTNGFEDTVDIDKLTSIEYSNLYGEAVTVSALLNNRSAPAPAPAPAGCGRRSPSVPACGPGPAPGWPAPPPPRRQRRRSGPWAPCRSAVPPPVRPPGSAAAASAPGGYTGPRCPWERGPCARSPPGCPPPAPPG